MTSIKKLASHTLWYGASSIAARFINYLLTPYLTFKLSESSYGEQSVLYAIIPFLNVLFTFGMETAYFRFASNSRNEKAVFNTASISIFVSTIFLSLFIFAFRQPFADFINIGEHPEYITWAVAVIALDTLAALSFAKLRYEGRPRQYAIIRILTIILNVLMVYFFYSLLPGIIEKKPNHLLSFLYSKDIVAGYYIIANIVSSGLAVLLLLPQLFSIRLEWDVVLWRKMMLYALPIMIAGLGGMINETLDRLMLVWWAPAIDTAERIRQVGIYSACYKLSMFVTLFVQAFRLGAEPFFFQQTNSADPKKVYARVMKFFVISVCFMFLVVTLYLDVFKFFIQNRKMWVGLAVVPILLCANIALGIYYNLSIWYKRSANTYPGLIITIFGVVITCVINYIFIPRYNFMACAWVTLLCYTSMMVISFFWGQKVYPIPYPLKRLSFYFLTMLALYFIDIGICTIVRNLPYRIFIGTLLLLVFITLVAFMERDEWKKIPLLRWVSTQIFRQ